LGIVRNWRAIPRFKTIQSLLREHHIEKNSIQADALGKEISESRSLAAIRTLLCKHRRPMSLDLIFPTVNARRIIISVRSSCRARPFSPKECILVRNAQIIINLENHRAFSSGWNESFFEESYTPHSSQKIRFTAPSQRDVAIMHRATGLYNLVYDSSRGPILRSILPPFFLWYLLLSEFSPFFELPSFIPSFLRLAFNKEPQRYPFSFFSPS